MSGQALIDIALMIRVLQHWGMAPVAGMEGTAYDFRAVRASEAGSWLQSVLESFEKKYGRKPKQFTVARPNLLLLA